MAILSPVSNGVGVTRIASKQGAFIIGISVGIAVAEYIFAYHNVAYGIIISLALAIVIYASLSFLNFDVGIVSSAESLALVPLYILFTSSLPWFFLNQEYLLPAVYSCILGLCFWHVYQKNLDLKEMFGFHRGNWKKYALISIGVGATLGIGEYTILRPAAAFPSFEFKYLLRDVVYMLFFVGLAEELLFRGMIQVDLGKAFGERWGLFGASVLFAVMHLTWRSVPELGFVFIAGMVLGWLYWKTGNMLPAILAHAANNVMLVGILPYVLRWS